MSCPACGASGAPAGGHCTSCGAAFPPPLPPPIPRDAKAAPPFGATGATRKISREQLRALAQGASRSPQSEVTRRIDPALLEDLAQRKSESEGQPEREPEREEDLELEVGRIGAVAEAPPLPPARKDLSDAFAEPTVQREPAQAAPAYFVSTQPTLQGEPSPLAPPTAPPPSSMAPPAPVLPRTPVLLDHAGRRPARGRRAGIALLAVAIGAAAIVVALVFVPAHFWRQPQVSVRAFRPPRTPAAAPEKSPAAVPIALPVAVQPREAAAPASEPLPAPAAVAVQAPAAAPAAANAAAPSIAPAGAPRGPCPAGAVLVSPTGKPPYCIDAYEYPGAGAVPKTDLTLAEAESLCAARGRRLCSPQEWEAACRGAHGASYPYGDTFLADTCNTAQDDGANGKPLGAAGAFPRCVSAAGAYDMSGNAAEWVQDGEIRGGSAQESGHAVRCSNRQRPAESQGPLIGFRCCTSPGGAF